MWNARLGVVRNVRRTRGDGRRKEELEHQPRREISFEDGEAGGHVADVECGLASRTDVVNTGASEFERI